MVLDVDTIRKLVEMMVENDLVEVSLRDGDVEVKLKRPNANGAVIVGGTELVLPSGVHLDTSAAAAAPSGAPGAKLVAPVEEDDSVDLVAIESPMVGTFYSGPSPDAPPFALIGMQVQSGTVVCILEAMKVFNEIKAEVAGTIERILVKNAQAVEFAQPLFMIRPM